MTWVAVGIGAAVGATAGAVAGSQKGGDDVWKGALLGGALGAAGGAPFGGAAAAEAALPAVAPEAAGILGGEALAPAAAESLAFTGPSVGSVVAAPAAESTGIAAAAPVAAPEAAIPMVQPPVPASTAFSGTPGPFAGSGSSFGTTGSASVSEGGGLLNEPAKAMGTNVPQQTSGTFGTNEPFGATPKSFAGSDQAFGSTGSANVNTSKSVLNDGGNASMFDKALGWVEENPFKAGILGFTALGLSGALNRNNNQTFGTSSVTQAGYPLSPDFAPSRYNPTRRYAAGGIADADRQTNMFPQSQMDRTQFATPSQMPISREIIDSDYDTTISPYTGDLPRFAKGGKSTAEQFAAMTDVAEAPQETPPAYVRRELVDPMDSGLFVDTDVETRDQPAMTAAQTRMAKLASKYGIAPRKLTAEESQKNMAGGGIADLGGYAHGGNPRLLRGPGDGMSDDIPATIANKQPARLADGEFVVPADVVSGLGNGSTEAGAKKLHQMMDKVRVDRTGTKKQGKKINADKYVPGMAQGGIASYASGNLVVQDNQVGTYDDSGNFNPINTSAFGQPTTSTGPASGTPSSQGYGLNKDYWTTGAGDIKYSPYTLANRPSADEPQFYGNIYRGQSPDYSTPGYTLTGGNLGEWSNVAGESTRAAQPASKNQQITQAYLQNLGRAPDTSGFNYWMENQAPLQDIKQGIAQSEEAKSITAASNADRVNQMYMDLLGRRPEEAGAQFWQNALAQGSTPEQVANQMKTSPEYQVRQMYQQYLGRTADPGGQEFWRNAIATGQATLEQVRSQIQNSEEGKAYAEKQAGASKETKKARKGGILSATKR